MEPAPAYHGEGPHALWHVSEDPSIETFAPHHRPEHARNEPLVYAVDTRHLPLYWFPRDCPRACFWANSHTGDDDIRRWLADDRRRRVHVVESGWMTRLREASVYAYRMPPESFERWDRFWVSHETVVPLEMVELGDLIGRHMRARIELRHASSLYPMWDDVVASTLDFSGIRIRNASLSG
jgi:hypothetical protein